MSSTNQDFDVTQGENAEIVFTIELDDGSGALDLTLVDTFTWRVVQASDETLVIEKTSGASEITVTDAANGKATCILDAADTDLPPQKYDHQLKVTGTDSGGDPFTRIVTKGKLQITDSVFR